MLLRNVDHYPEKLSKSKIEDQFAHFDEVFKSLDNVEISKNIECKLIQEQPPNKTDISQQVLNMIKTADSHIRIIQPYVQNIDELEDRLIEAMEKRGVKVEIISARNRDQPCYKGFLNSSLFANLQAKGAKVYEEPFKYLHMKAISIDNGKVMTIGSFNQDHWSFYCNNEANMLIKDHTRQPHPGVPSESPENIDQLHTFK